MMLKRFIAMTWDTICNVYATCKITCVGNGSKDRQENLVRNPDTF